MREKKEGFKLHYTQVVMLNMKVVTFRKRINK